MNAPEKLGYRLSGWISRNRLLARFIFGIPILYMLIVFVRDIVELALETSWIAYAGVVVFGLPVICIVLKDKGWKLDKQAAMVLGMLLFALFLFSLFPASVKH